MTIEQLQTLKAVAENNDLDAIIRLKSYYLNVQHDVEKEYYYHRKAAALHHAPSEYVLGMGYLFGFDGIPINKKEGIKYMQAAAEDGIADAWFILGQLHANEKLDFIEYSKQKSFDCFKASAKMGFALAQLELGDIYMFEYKELDKAIFWWACAYLHDDKKDEENSKNAKNRLNDLAKLGIPGEFQKINSIIEKVKNEYVQYTLRPQYTRKTKNNE